MIQTASFSCRSASSRGSVGAAWLLALLLCLPAPGAFAADEPASNGLHGFASLGFIATTGNNYYGDTRGGGDFDYYEVGVNGYASLTPSLTASGQLLVRRAGATDDGQPRIDYAFFDYRLREDVNARYGLRLGRVRNALGFYNATRDVVFTRPSVLLPHSAYLEGAGLRELQFSADGAQLYGDFDHEDGHTVLSLTLGLDRRLSGQSRDNLLRGATLAPYVPGSVDQAHPVFARILHEIDGGRVRMALSLADMRFTSTFTAGGLPDVPVNLDARLYIASLQYNAEAWSLTGEYTLVALDLARGGTTTRSEGDGVYLQYQYRFDQEWSALLRQDYTWPDRNDRGRNLSRDFTVGVRWMPQPDWLLSAEYHRIHGTAGIPTADNPGRPLDPDTDLFALVVGCRF